MNDRSAGPGRDALLHALHAEIPASLYWADRASPERDSLELQSAHALRLLDRLSWVEFDTAMAALDSAAILDPRLGVMLAFLRGRAALVRGGRERARAEVEVTLRDMGTDSAGRRALEQLRVQLLVSAGRAEAALASVDADPVFFGVAERARAGLGVGQFSRVRGLIESSERFERAPLRERVDLRVMLAAAFDRLGDRARTRCLLREAIAQLGDLDSAVFMLSTADRRMLRAAGGSDPVLHRAAKKVDRGLTIDAFVYPIASFHGAGLTSRERVVLQHLATDLPLKQIAQRLGVSANTLNSQVRSIYRKLGVNSRTAAVQTATAQELMGARNSLAS